MMKLFEVFMISLFLRYIYSLNNIENIINVDIKNLGSKEELQDQSSVKPLSFLTEEINLIRRYIIATLEDTEIFANPNCIYDLTNYFTNYSCAIHREVPEKFEILFQKHSKT